MAFRSVRWPAIKNRAANVLHRAYLDMVGENGLELMSRENSDFNESIVVFLPKKLVTVTETLDSWQCTGIIFAAV